MLADLGFYNGDIDGKIGTGSMNAAVAFAKQYGVSLSGGITNDFCARLIEAWQVAMTQPAPVEPAVTPAPTTGGSRIIFSKIPRSMFRTVAQTTTGAQTTNGEQPTTSGQGWWASQPTTTKVAIGAGAIAVAALGAYMLMGKGSKAT
jgi:peptidoglycan hydrolase-like protein with peptidoglycan-binding domain